MKFKNKWLKLILIFSVFYPNLSMNFYDQERGLALSRPSSGEEPYWESYNEWRCFDRDTVELVCAELQHKDGSFNAYIAIMSILVDGYLFEYHPLLETKQDCFPIAVQWFNLIKDEKEVCIYGAYLNDIEPFEEGFVDGSIWYINQIKTGHGYWKAWRDEDYFSDGDMLEEGRELPEERENQKVLEIPDDQLSDDQINEGDVDTEEI